jgi:hypothetical protein
VESIGNNFFASSFVNEVGKKQKLGFKTSPTGMKISTIGGMSSSFA